MCKGIPLGLASQLAMSQGHKLPKDTIYGRRLVFFGAAEDVSEPTLLQLFAKHGDVTGLFLVRSALGLPSGCGYVTMATTEQAKAAAAALHGTPECAEEGGRLGLLVVGLPELSNNQFQADNMTPADDICNGACSTIKDSKTVFFTKVPPTVTAQQLIQLFTSCGDVVHVELFTPWPGAKISKGCGLVEFSHVDAAAAAVNSLHQAFTWPHSHSPLVVEWVDSKRQQANRASKLNKAAAAAAVVAGDRGIHRAVAVPAEKQLSSGAVYGLGNVLLNGGSTLQQQSSLSASLPQLQQAWAQQATVFSPQSGYLLPQQQLASMSAGMVQAEWILRQQPQNTADCQAAASTTTFSPSLRQSISGISNFMSSSDRSNSLMSNVDRSASLATTLTSTISNGSTVFNVNPNDLSSSSLACPVSAAFVPAASNSNELHCSFMLRSPNRSEAGMAKTAAVNPGANHLNPVWQQLQQQNVMMLQPLASTAEEQMNGSGQLLPNGSSSLAAVYQNAAMGSTLGTSTNMLNASSLSALHSSASGLGPSEVDLLLQQQQLQMHTSPLGNAASSRPPLQQQQQWWNQQPAQLQKDESSVIVVPLTVRQLQVMSGVLPEVPKLTGAQACLMPGSVDGSVHLMLSGRMSEVQSGHCVVSMLLAQLGVEDPLMPAMAQRMG